MSRFPDVGWWDAAAAGALVTVRYITTGPSGPGVSQWDLSLPQEAPDSNKLPQLLRLFARYVVAPVMSGQRVVFVMEWTNWRVSTFPLVVPVGDIFGTQFGGEVNLHESATLVSHTGQWDHYARRRHHIPGTPTRFITNHQVNKTGQAALQNVVCGLMAQGGPLGQHTRFRPVHIYRGSFLEGDDGPAAVKWRPVQSFRVCTHTSHAPDWNGGF